MKIRVILVGLMLAIALFAAACDKVTISKIQANPAKYQGKEIGIIGTVRDSYGAPLVGGAYKVEDETGSIWVVAKGRSAPSKGARIAVKGTVQEGFQFGGRNYGLVIIEDDRRVK